MTEPTLVERLEDAGSMTYLGRSLFDEAAAELRRLEAENRQLREAVNMLNSAAVRHALNSSDAEG